jgi:hypothetical protein
LKRSDENRAPASAGALFFQLDFSASKQTVINYLSLRAQIHLYFYIDNAVKCNYIDHFPKSPETLLPQVISGTHHIKNRRLTFTASAQKMYSRGEF